MIDRTSDQFLLDAYNGTGGFANGAYLQNHRRESSEKFAERKALATYPNFCRKIVDVMMGFLWRQTPAREVDDLYAAFQNNADGVGGKLDTQLFICQRLAMLLGTVYVVVDKPQTQGSTRATEALPYLVVRLPSQLVAESKNRMGEWDSVTFAEMDGTKTLYRSYTTTNWRLCRDIEGLDVLAEGAYFADGRTLGRVPVVKYHISKPLLPTASCSKSWFADVAALNWAIFNRESELTEILRNQTFSILTFPINDPADAQGLSTLTVGTENALTFNPAGGGKPDFIAPLEHPVSSYMKKIDALVDTIYRMANLEFIGSVQPSGEALKYHFDETNSSLGGMAEMGEAAEIAIAQLVYAWQGQIFDGNIAYPPEFNLTDLTSAISIALDSVPLNMGAGFDRAIKKRLAKQILGNDTAAQTMATIDAEIDAMGDVYGDRIAKQT